MTTTDANAAVSSALSGLVGGTSSATNSSNATTKTGDLASKTLGESDFLNLLITQLKNQDPMNPMDDQQFAVQLAQFSSLQELIDINGKVGQPTTNSGDLSSLSSYLGHDVVTNSSTATVQNNSAGQAAFTLPTDAADVSVQLIDSGGSVVESKDFGAMKAGEQTADLSGLSTSGGTYTLQATVTDANGGQSTIAAYTAGMVSGVIPGANPMLIVNGNQISTSNVTEVACAFNDLNAFLSSVVVLAVRSLNEL